MLHRTTAFVFLLTSASAAYAQDWSQWRGPDRNGHLPASPALIDALPDDGISPLWMSEGSVPTGGGGGWASPVVAGGRVYLFAHVKQRREGVELPEEKYPRLDDAAREKLSKEKYDEYEQARRDEQSRRRDLQYRHDELLICFDAESGEQLWVNQHESRRTRYAQSASPAVMSDVAFVHGARGKVRAVNTENG